MIGHVNFQLPYHHVGFLGFDGSHNLFQYVNVARDCRAARAIFASEYHSLLQERGHCLGTEANGGHSSRGLLRLRLLLGNEAAIVCDNHGLIHRQGPGRIGSGDFTTRVTNHR